ncbi:Protein disulfide-isomerase SCO2 [Frankliniella fusca]|uniref:Protein disulfide-isomerase SCO2 n=1 Tax=Frankliniella fusca TaxID=407009 RepID=A0AAE1HRR3_9NEOP|nr:Protein disulfide-isomerase SCO2 [Frankliniella fusca]
MQPLDVGFFSPFETFYNPARPPTIYRVAGFVKDALCKAATPHNVIKCFETTGVVPYNRHIFSEQDFMMASVTASPDPSTEAPHLNQEETEADVNGNTVSDLNEEEVEIQEPSSLTPAINPGTPNLNRTASVENVSLSGKEISLIGPMLIRGLPKAKPSKATRKPRRKGKCMVATDTPAKEEIRLREEAQKQKQDKTEDLKRKREVGQVSKKGSKDSKIQTKKVKRNQQVELESDNSEEADDVNSVPPAANCVRSFPQLEKDPEEGGFVLVSFQAGKKSVVYFVGKILSEADIEGDLEISYYRKKN